MKTKSIFKLVSALAINFLLMVIIGNAIGFADVLGFAGIATTFFAVITFVITAKGYKTSNYAFMALQTEVWQNDIMEILYPANDFMSKCRDHSMYVSHLTVHIPQNQVKPTVRKNYTTLPITANTRTDVDFTYQLNNYKIEPTVIPNLEELQISYAKRESVMYNYYQELQRSVANNTLYSWASAGTSNIVKFSGSATGSVLAPFATGTRNAITLADIAAAKAKLDKQNIPAQDRILLMDSDIYNNQFLAIQNIQQYYAYGTAILPEGVVGKIFGFNVMVRPSVLYYTSAFTPVAITDTGDDNSNQATDNVACLAFHPKFVASALGSINVYYQENNPLYYGPVLSAEIQHGASPMYQNNLGVVTLCQQ